MNRKREEQNEKEEATFFMWVEEEEEEEATFFIWVAIEVCVELLEPFIEVAPTCVFSSNFIKCF